MMKTITTAVWDGGGVWGIPQLYAADNIFNISGIHLADIIHLHQVMSVGNIAGLVTATKKSYGEAQISFRDCAEQMMGGKLRETQLTNQVIHSLHHLNKHRIIRKRLFGDKTGKIHLNHNILGDFIDRSFGNMRLSDLDTSFVSLTHHTEENEKIGFATIKGDGPFNPDKWAVIPNHGDHHTLRDVVMASTAAPSAFGPHQIGPNNYIDNGNNWTPLPVLKNIFRMVTDPHNTRVNILYFGTGKVAKDCWNAEAYRNQGILQFLSDWDGAKSSAQLKHDLREMATDYGDRVSITMIDTPVPDTYKGKPFVRDQFLGSTKYLDAIEDITLTHLRKIGKQQAEIVERIAEQQQKESAVDPLVGRPTPTTSISLLSRIAQHPHAAPFRNLRRRGLKAG